MQLTIRKRRRHLLFWSRCITSYIGREESTAFTVKGYPFIYQQRNRWYREAIVVAWEGTRGSATERKIRQPRGLSYWFTPARRDVTNPVLEASLKKEKRKQI